MQQPTVLQSTKHVNNENLFSTWRSLFISDIKELKLSYRYRLTEITIKAKLVSQLVILVFYCDGSSTSDSTHSTAYCEFFLNDFKNKPLNMLILGESLKLFPEPKNLKKKACVFLSHLKKRHGYDFPVYFPHELLMSFWMMHCHSNTLKTGTFRRFIRSTNFLKVDNNTHLKLLDQGLQYIWKRFWWGDDVRPS